MSDHGPQYDEFSRGTRHAHGGSEYDAGFTRDPGTSRAHGAQEDQGYRKPTALDGKHGEHWDEFGWTPMPAKHGQQFDENFGAPTALDGSTGHGTWQDVFTEGTQVRAIVGGRDVEAIVAHCNPDHVVAQTYGRNQGGARVELGLGQIREWRKVDKDANSAPKPTAHPGNTPAPITDSTAHAPSAHDAKASGGHLRQTHKVHLPDDLPEDLLEDLLKVVAADDELIEKARHGGGARGKVGSQLPAKAPRHADTGMGHAAGLIATPAGKRDKAWHAQARQTLRSRATAVRTAATKAGHAALPPVHHGGFSCASCGHQSFHVHKVASPSGGTHGQIAMRGCAKCHLMHPTRIGKTSEGDVDLAKVDTSETALQGDTTKTVGHRTNCPRGGSAPCGAAVDGKCSACGAGVSDHAAVGKTADPLVLIRSLVGEPA